MFFWKLLHAHETICHKFELLLTPRYYLTPDSVPVFQQAEDALSVPKEYLFLGVSSTLLAFLLLGIGVGSLCSMIGFFYPAWASFKAIETKQKGDDTQWLIYWTVYAFFSILEAFIDFLLYFVPFYYAFKLAFLLWMMLPQTRGAAFLYDSFLKDFLKRNEARIDEAISKAQRSASTVVAEAATAGAEVAGAGLSAAAKAMAASDKED
jgi:receptor expression-enhancing protein 5/6